MKDHFAIWLGLVEGRFRVVDRFETDMRRWYVVRGARSGDPTLALNPQERRLVEIVGSGQSLKVASFDLGLRPSAASSLLKSALVKLGLRSRTDLVLLVRSIGEQKPDDDGKDLRASAQGFRESPRLTTGRV
jgi:DNA-binding CsgD family transcriptional regulator